MSISTGEAEKLFAAYTQKDCVGFMITFGTDERVKFEEIRDTISESVCRQKNQTGNNHFRRFEFRLISPYFNCLIGVAEMIT